ncbi:MAG: hypothetical protein JW993_01360 [Sedimentisphaerales bacterium]|nr:hypothetical protein [Sedimentisphaerales bacterium]
MKDGSQQPAILNVHFPVGTQTEAVVRILKAWVETVDNSTTRKEYPEGVKDMLSCPWHRLAEHGLKVRKLHETADVGVTIRIVLKETVYRLIHESTDGRLIVAKSCHLLAESIKCPMEREVREIHCSVEYVLWEPPPLHFSPNFTRLVQVGSDNRLKTYTREESLQTTTQVPTERFRSWKSTELTIKNAYDDTQMRVFLFQWLHHFSID